MNKILKLDDFCKNLISEGGIFGKNGFFDKNKFIILISFLAGIFANLTTISTLVYGFDLLAAIYSDYFKTFLYADLRPIAAILYKLLPFLSVPSISDIVGIFILSLSACLMVDKLNLSNVAKGIFTILFVTHPSWCHLVYFHHQFAYNAIGILFAVLGFLLIIKETDNNKLYSSHIFLSIILLLLAILTYQNIISIFAMLGAFYAMLTFVEKRDFKYSLTILLKVIIISIISLILYWLLVKLLLGGFHGYQNSMIRNYHNMEDILNNISVAVTQSYRLLISRRSYSHLTGLPASIFLLIFFFISASRLNKVKEILKLTLFFIAYIGACISLTIFMNISFWSYFYMSFYFVASSILAYTIFKSNLWKVSFIIVFTFITFSNIQYTYINQQAQIITAENDKVIMQRVLDIVYDKAPEVYEGKKPIVFIGFLPTDNKHPFLQKSKWQHNISILNWDQVGLFLKLHGLPTNVEVVNSSGYIFKDLYDIHFFLEKKEPIHLEAKEIAKSMPSYPDRDCVKVEDDYVIVKLGSSQF